MVDVHMLSRRGSFSARNVGSVYGGEVPVGRLRGGARRSL